MPYKLMLGVADGTTGQGGPMFGPTTTTEVCGMVPVWLAITTLTVDAQHLIVGPMHRHKSHGITQDEPTTVTASFLLWLMRV